VGSFDERKEVIMASQSKQSATNERIVRLLEELKAQLAESSQRQEQIARDLARVLDRR
jgi:CRISPR/Cas system CSM-associated protein Csm2 small subunit